ncbi:conserved protein of unknown function [Rhodovastum atsumiense]|uniref:Sel1 repeat family protein n=2 Tax=Rhodovastum atsumiense TaxID=504468 RepID=A0A5M6IPC3_9PROT|nr:hypothetical protein F1189_22860 [Rhodovastum atsumiense]CAH2604506.1 conserved protein of unknown function [Rhodovastum atsumiense]
MDLAGFRQSLDAPAPPTFASLALQGLWWDGKGDWDQAHRCAQDQDDAPGAAVHAYLHRKEGDPANARYWYARAGRRPVDGALEDEWTALVCELLAAEPP